LVAREEERFAGLERRLEAFEEEVRAAGEMSSRLDEVDRAIGKAEQRLSQVEERLGEVETKQSVGEVGQPEKPRRQSHERSYPDVVTPNPLPDDAAVYGEAAENSGHEHGRGPMSGNSRARHRPFRADIFEQ